MFVYLVPELQSGRVDFAAPFGVVELLRLIAGSGALAQVKEPGKL